MRGALWVLAAMACAAVPAWAASASAGARLPAAELSAVAALAEKRLKAGAAGDEEGVWGAAVAVAVARRQGVSVGSIAGPKGSSAWLSGARAALSGSGAGSVEGVAGCVGGEDATGCAAAAGARVGGSAKKVVSEGGATADLHWALEARVAGGLSSGAVSRAARVLRWRLWPAVEEGRGGDVGHVLRGLEAAGWVAEGGEGADEATATATATATARPAAAAEVKVEGVSVVLGSEADGGERRVTARVPGDVKKAAKALAVKASEWVQVLVDGVDVGSVGRSVVLIRVRDVATGQAHTLAAHEAARSKSYQAKFHVGSRPSFLAPGGGDVAVDVIVAAIDAGVAQVADPLVFSALATLAVPARDDASSSSASAATNPEILYSKPLLHASDVALAPLPTITHRFRPDERQVPAVVGLAVAAGVAFILATAAQRGAAAAGPWGASLGLQGLAFLALLLAVFAVDFAYFFGVHLVANAFQAIAAKTLLVLATIVVGRSTLRTLRDQT
jgi:hypothetical protein